MSHRAMHIVNNYNLFKDLQVHILILIYLILQLLGRSIIYVTVNIIQQYFINLNLI